MHLVFTYFFSALALYASSILALSFLAAKIPAAGFYARILSSFACLVFCAWYGVVASVVLRCIGYGGLSQWTVARCFQWTMRWATGVQFAVQGEEHLVTRPAVFIGNHQTYAVSHNPQTWILTASHSELDVLMLGAIFPPYCSVTAKKSLKYVPILGWFSTFHFPRINSEHCSSRLKQWRLVRLSSSIAATAKLPNSPLTVQQG